MGRSELLRVLPILLFTSYAAYSIAAFALVSNSLFTLAFFEVALICFVLIAFLNKRRKQIASTLEISYRERTIAILYILTLCLAIVMFIQYVYFLLLFALEIVALGTNLLFMADKSARYLTQLALLLPSSIYATELDMNFPTVAGNAFLLLFYVVWLAMLASLNHRRVTS